MGDPKVQADMLNNPFGILHSLFTQKQAFSGFSSGGANMFSGGTNR